MLFVCLSRLYDAANQEEGFPMLCMTLQLCDRFTARGNWGFKNSSAYSDAADDYRKIALGGKAGTPSASFP